MRTLLVDFNSIRKGRVAGLRRSLSGYGEPHEGERVLLYDGEHQMEGTVEQVTERLIQTAVDRTTWTDSGRSVLDDLTQVINDAAQAQKTVIEELPVTQGSSARDSFHEFELA